MPRYSFLLVTCCVLLFAACSSLRAPSWPTPIETAPASEPTAEDQGEAVGSPRSAVFINESKLLIMESFPVQVVVEVSGELPTPCHQLVADVAEPDDLNRIFIDVYSANELVGVDCVQILEPFEESIPVPMVDQPDSIYTIWINGQKVGEFSYPA